MTIQLRWNRRDWMRTGLAGAAAGFHTRSFAAAPARPKSVIFLWLAGGPATIDLWDLKPDHENGGPFRPIETATPGVQISEHLPKLAQQSQHLAIVRSMTTREGDHTRATHLLRTGYKPQGAIRFPAFGALVSQERGSSEADLPQFVSISPTSDLNEVGAGFLDPQFAPFNLGASNSQGDLNVPNLSEPEGLSPASREARMRFLKSLDAGFAAGHRGEVTDSLQAAVDRAVRLMCPEAASAFDLSGEADSLRASYGRDAFGQGCLLARRLVERQVPFVEVTLGGWDAHRNNFEQVERLSQRLDAAFATLLTDLRDRGLLDSTLVVCQGEFGRTPRINANSGRDHWPASWSVALAGGGIRGGQALGATSNDGTEVVERPVGVPDLIATLCEAASIDPRRQNISNVSRPIRIADPDAKPIRELLG